MQILQPNYSIEIKNLNTLLLLEIKERIEDVIEVDMGGEKIGDKFKVMLMIDKESLESMKEIPEYRRFLPLYDSITVL